MTAPTGMQGLPDDVSAALGRLLHKEERVADLLGLLCALDPRPLVDALGLAVEHPRVVREAVVRTGTAKAGRADLVVRDSKRPVALLELKIGASEHGSQFTKYDAWASEQGGLVRLLVGLVEEPGLTPDGWRTDLTLPLLLRAWVRSRSPHASWLALAAAEVLKGWVRQVDGPIGRAVNPAVADLVVRRVVTDLKADPFLRGAGLSVYAGRTSGGTASITGWLPYPCTPPDPQAWLCADLRAGARAHPGAPWLLRLGVQVDAGPGRTVGQARAAAHDLAVPFRTALTTSALRASLTAGDRPDLAVAVSAWPRSKDGLRAHPDRQALDDWKQDALDGKQPGRHPALFHDWGRRLATQTALDVLQVDRLQVRDIVVAALMHLHASARERLSGGA